MLTSSSWWAWHLLQVMTSWCLLFYIHIIIYIYRIIGHVFLCSRSDLQRSCMKVKTASGPLPYSNKSHILAEHVGMDTFGRDVFHLKGPWGNSWAWRNVSATREETEEIALRSPKPTQWVDSLEGEVKGSTWWTVKPPEKSVSWSQESIRGFRASRFAKKGWLVANESLPACHGPTSLHGNSGLFRLFDCMHLLYASGSSTPSTATRRSSCESWSPMPLMPWTRSDTSPSPTQTRLRRVYFLCWTLVAFFFSPNYTYGWRATQCHTIPVPRIPLNLCQFDELWSN